MDFKKRIGNLTWKQLVAIGLGIFITFLIIREIFVWALFHELKQMTSQFNAQFEQEQNEVQNAIKDSEQEFHERSQEFDKRASHFSRDVDDFQKRAMDYFDKIDAEREQREAEFDKYFKEAPKAMEAAFDDIGKDMQKGFERDSRKMHEDFKKNVMDVNKQTEKVRCEMALKDDLAALPPPVNLTPEQLKERNKTLQQFRREIAKREHCEAFL